MILGCPAHSVHVLNVAKVCFVPHPLRVASCYPICNCHLFPLTFINYFSIEDYTPHILHSTYVAFLQCPRAHINVYHCQNSIASLTAKSHIVHVSVLVNITAVRGSRRSDMFLRCPYSQHCHHALRTPTTTYHK